MSTDIKLSKAHLAKIIQSSGFHGNMMGNLSKKALLHLSTSLAKYVLPKLATKATSSILDKNKNKWERDRKSRFISNEDMNDNRLFSQQSLRQFKA